MKPRWPNRTTRSALSLLVLSFLSCGGTALPAVPAFDALGFDTALEVVQQQVRDAYTRWREQPRDAARNGHLGMLLSVYGKNGFAEVLYRRAHTLDPDAFRWTYYLAVTVGEAGRHEEAVALLREALELNPRYVAARIRLARMLLEKNDIEQSAELYRALTLELPDRVEGWLGLGKALERRGDLAGATEALRRARAVGPDYGEVHYALAQVLIASGNERRAARALAAYERTVGNIIQTPDPLVREVSRLNLGDAPLMAQADYQLRQGRLEQAIDSFRAVLAINPANQDAWAVLVQTQARLDRIDDAGVTYRDALAAGISSARLHLIYGQALVRQQRLDEAHDVIARAIESDAHYAQAWLAMGELEVQRDQGAVAIAALRRYLSLQPNDREVIAALARMLNADGQFAEAATRLEPLRSDAEADRALVLKELALAYRGLSRNDEAIALLQDSRAAAAEQEAGAQLVADIDALLATWQRASAD